MVLSHCRRWLPQGGGGGWWWETVDEKHLVFIRKFRFWLINKGGFKTWGYPKHRACFQATSTEKDNFLGLFADYLIIHRSKVLFWKSWAILPPPGPGCYMSEDYSYTSVSLTSSPYEPADLSYPSQRMCWHLTHAGFAGSS